MLNTKIPLLINELFDSFHKLYFEIKGKDNIKPVLSFGLVSEINDTARLLGGGVEFPLSTGGFVHSANLTPDESGLQTWTEEAFVKKFKSYQDSGAIYKVAPNSFNSVMPWSDYDGLTEKDLKAIYAHLRSIKPVYNPVIVFTKKSLRHVKAGDQTGGN